MCDLSANRTDRGLCPSCCSNRGREDVRSAPHILSTTTLAISRRTSRSRGNGLTQPCSPRSSASVRRASKLVYHSHLHFDAQQHSSLPTDSLTTASIIHIIIPPTPQRRTITTHSNLPALPSSLIHYIRHGVGLPTTTTCPSSHLFARLTSLALPHTLRLLHLALSPFTFRTPNLLRLFLPLPRLLKQPSALPRCTVLLLPRLSSHSL